METFCFNIAKTSSYRVKTTPKLVEPPPPFGMARTFYPPPFLFFFFHRGKTSYAPPPLRFCSPTPHNDGMRLTMESTDCRVLVSPLMTMKNLCLLTLIKHSLFCSTFWIDWVVWSPVLTGNWKSNHKTLKNHVFLKPLESCNIDRHHIYMQL